VAVVLRSKSQPCKGRAAVRAGMVKDAFNKATTDDVFSPAKFAGSIDRIQKSTNGDMPSST